MALFTLIFSFARADEINLTLAGTQENYDYTAKILTRVLEAQGHTVNISSVGDLPMTRLEAMMAAGDISCLILGKTDSRTEQFGLIDIGMTNNLIGQRILFIRGQDQFIYNNVNTLEEFRATDQVAGMGQAWGDVSIWHKNSLPVQPIVGEWRQLYKMVESGQRGIDYISRGAQEMLDEYLLYPDLTVEKKLVLVYQRDHVLYVSPILTKLYRQLSTALEEAQANGLIADIVRGYYPEVYEDPINLDQRRVINLALP